MRTCARVYSAVCNRQSLTQGGVSQGCFLGLGGEHAETGSEGTTLYPVVGAGYGVHVFVRLIEPHTETCLIYWL